MDTRYDQYITPLPLKEVEQGKVYVDGQNIFIIEKLLGAGKAGSVCLVHEISQPHQKFCFKFDSNLERAQLENAIIKKYFQQFTYQPHPKVSTSPFQSNYYVCQSGTKTYHVCVEPFIDGVTLDIFLKNKPISETVACSLFDSFLSQTAHLHQLGHFQRDIKLDNLMVVQNDDDLLSIVLIDFGIASKITETDISATPNSSWVDYLKNVSHHSSLFIFGFKKLPSTKSRIAPEHLNQDETINISRKSEAFSAGYILEKIIDATHFETSRLKYDLIELSERLKHPDISKRSSLEEVKMVIRDNYLSPLNYTEHLLVCILTREDLPSYCRFCINQWPIDNGAITKEQLELIHDCVNYYIAINKLGFSKNHVDKINKYEACLALIRAIAENQPDFMSDFNDTLTKGELNKLTTRFLKMHQTASTETSFTIVN
jgi:serine/threonine protein kinase